MRILVTGAAGQVGTELVALLDGHDVTAATRTDLDIADGDAVRQAVAASRPDAIVNCAAYNAVDAAETDEAGAMAVNRDGPANLAAAAETCGAHLVHISTDYVFAGDKGSPYDERDEPNPLSVYGRSKLAGEQAVAASSAPWTIVRTAWVFGRIGRSLVEFVLRQALAGEPLRMVTDQHGSPTYAQDLAGLLVAMVHDRVTGLFHGTNDGYCTPHDLAVAVSDVAGCDVEVEAVTTAELGRPAPRPSFSALTSVNLDASGIPPLRHYREALAEAVPQLVEVRASGRTA